MTGERTDCIYLGVTFVFVVLIVSSKIFFMRECSKHMISRSWSFVNLDIIRLNVQICKLISNSCLNLQLKKLLQTLNPSSGSADGQMVPKFLRNKHWAKLVLMLQRMFFSPLLNDLLEGLIQRLVLILLRSGLVSHWLLAELIPFLYTLSVNIC
jgi:hypothetical protein